MADLPPPSPGPPAAAKPPRWPAIAWRVLTLVAIGLAIGSWFRPVPHDKPAAMPTYADEQVAGAKTHVCATYGKVRKAMAATGARSAGGGPTLGLAVATSSRQALVVGSEYLLTTLAAEPASPPDLAKAVRELANLYQEITVDYLGEIGDTELNPVLHAAKQPTLTIEKLCK